MGVCISARDKVSDKNNIAGAKKNVFMISWRQELTQIHDRFNPEARLTPGSSTPNFAVDV
jgi:hypothetical protein